MDMNSGKSGGDGGAGHRKKQRNYNDDLSSHLLLRGWDVIYVPMTINTRSSSSLDSLYSFGCFSLVCSLLLDPTEKDLHKIIHPWRELSSKFTSSLTVADDYDGLTRTNWIGTFNPLGPRMRPIAIEFMSLIQRGFQFEGKPFNRCNSNEHYHSLYFGVSHRQTLVKEIKNNSIVRIKCSISSDAVV